MVDSGYKFESKSNVYRTISFSIGRINKVGTLPRTCHKLTQTLTRTCHNLTQTLPRTCLNLTYKLIDIILTAVRYLSQLNPNIPTLHPEKRI